MIRGLLQAARLKADIVVSILFYSSEKNRVGQELQGIIEEMVLGEDIEACRTILNLADRLRRPRGGLHVAVILAASREELFGLLSIRDLLRDLRMILVLPDREKETISLAHTLYPRFLAYADEDAWPVEAVLKNMLAVNGREKRLESREIKSEWQN